MFRRRQRLYSLREINEYIGNYRVLCDETAINYIGDVAASVMLEVVARLNEYLLKEGK